MEELFEMVHEEIKKSGYDGLLPAGLVLTGGTAELPGILELQGQTLDLPTRIGCRWDLRSGRFDLPAAYSTAVGLLLWALTPYLAPDRRGCIRGNVVDEFVSRLVRWLRAFIP